jgi:hypothetical protein
MKRSFDVRIFGTLLVVAALNACDTASPVEGEFGDCAPCGWVLVKLGAEPFPTGSSGTFLIKTGSSIPEFWPSYSGLGSTEAGRPGEYRVMAGVPWGLHAPPGDTLRVWVKAVWYDKARNEALVDRDSVLITVRYPSALNGSQPEDTAALTLHRRLGFIGGSVTGSPVPLTITASGPEIRSVTTDGNREFSFIGLRVGSYTVRISGVPDGLTCVEPTQSQSFTVVAGQGTVVNFSCSPQT